VGKGRGREEEGKEKRMAKQPNASNGKVEKRHKSPLRGVAVFDLTA
jgi:hypothetical protein